MALVRAVAGFSLQSSGYEVAKAAALLQSIVWSFHPGEDNVPLHSREHYTTDICAIIY